MSLFIFNLNNTEPTDYIERKVTKAVILNEEGQVLLFGSGLIGGGVEEGETDEGALHREAMEEAGIEIEIIKLLGEVIGYRDFLKKKYVARGYLCRYLNKINEPTSSDSQEQKTIVTWESIEDVINRLQSEIDVLKKARPILDKDDKYQSRLYNREMSLSFLKEVSKEKS